MCLIPENMTETKAKTIQQRFVEYGCSERFELLEIIDKYHVFIRCKGCGYKFARETSFLKKSKTHNIECRSCGTHADGSHTPPCSENKRSMDESVVVEYYNQNNSATQTAKKFGMNLRRVRRIIDEAGVSRDRQIVIKFDDYPDVITGNQWLDEEFECAECKRLFTRHQYMIKMNRKSRLLKPPKFCSLTCSRRSANRGRRAKSKERRKAEKSTVIPLGDLIERDGGIC